MDAKSSTLVLENRSVLTLSGVTEIRAFDDRTVMLYTVMGELSVLGRELRMDQLSTSSGEIKIEGDIIAVRYGDRDRTGSAGAVRRLLR